MHPKNILITGGTGLLGTSLLKLLTANGYRVAILSRNTTASENCFRWDIKTKYIDANSLEETDTIIHLAGASIADGRWTTKRKRELIDSRVKSAELLYEKLKDGSHNVKTFISASGIGFYGDTKDTWADENSPAGNGFQSEICIAWENVTKKIASLGIRIVIIRIGIVLAKEGGAFPVLAKPVKYFIGSPLGSGKQYLSWIHVDDACAVYLKAVGDEKMSGVFNAVASGPVTQKEFMRSLANNLHRRLLHVNVPSWFLKLLLGEKAEIVLSGQRVSNQKLLDSGFRFRYDQLDGALKDILR